MKFDYDYYRKILLFMAIGILIIGMIVMICGIYTLKSKTLTNGFLSKKFIKILLFFGCICALLFCAIDSIGKLKYGIYLINEKPEDALVIQGEIEEIKEIKDPFEHTYKSIEGEEFKKYTPLERDAHLITISGKKYYFMIKGELKVGDNVEISYLPKSTIVLEVNIIYPE